MRYSRMQSSALRKLEAFLVGYTLAHAYDVLLGWGCLTCAQAPAHHTIDLLHQLLLPVCWLGACRQGCDTPGIILRGHSTPPAQPRAGAPSKIKGFAILKACPRCKPLQSGPGTWEAPPMFKALSHPDAGASLTPKLLASRLLMIVCRHSHGCYSHCCR